MKTKFKLDIFFGYATAKVRERKMRISQFFLFEKQHSVENHWTITKFEFNIHISNLSQMCAKVVEIMIEN